MDGAARRLHPIRGLLVALGLTALVAGCGGKRAAVTTTSDTKAIFSVRAVETAFAGANLDLHNPAPPASTPHVFATVTLLTSVRPHEGWTVAAYVYPTRSEANASFDEDAGEWSSSGIAAAHEGNLVVVVIPRGHLLSRPAAVFPMPAVIYKALNLLPRAG